MTNPFNDSPHGRDGTDPEFGTLTTQGFHSLSAADVDGDGKQEIVYGAATIDHDGSLLYSSFDNLPPEPGSTEPGEHWPDWGTATQCTSPTSTLIAPDWRSSPCTRAAPRRRTAWRMRDAEDGEVIFGVYSGRDTGRGMVGDVRAGIRGLESWASLPGGSDGARAAAPPTGQRICTARSPAPTEHPLGGRHDHPDRRRRAATSPRPSTTGSAARLLTAEGTRTNNGTKGNPSLVADVFGDWREEMLVRTADSSAIRIYLSTEVTDRKLYTLMHDPQYRVEVARQQTTYNQPSYPSFYLASDLDWSKVPVPPR